MVRGLDNNNVSHEIRAEEEGERLDDVGTLGNITREGIHGELLIGTKHDKIRTENDTSLLGLEIEDLNGGVVGSAVSDDASLVTRSTSTARGTLVAVSLLLKGRILVKKFLNDRGEFLGPELFAGVEHVGLASNGADLTSLDVADVDTLILIEGDGATALNDVNRHRRDVVSRTVDHPAVTRGTLGVTISEGLASSEKESLVLVQNVDVLDAALKLLTGTKEEGDFSNTKLALSKLGDSVLDGVDNDGVLMISGGSKKKKKRIPGGS